MPDDQWEIQSEKPAPRPPLNMAKSTGGVWEVASEQPAPAYVGPARSIQAAPKPFTWPWAKQELTNFEEGATKSLPAIGATIGGIFGAPGGILGATGGAGIGGMGGAAAKQLTRRALGFEDAPKTLGEAASDITREGITQGAIQGLTEGAGRLAGPLRGAAVTQYERALAPTTRQNKVIAERITPELIDRRVRGSLSDIEGQASAQATKLRPQLDAAYQATPAVNTVGSGTKIVQELEGLKGKYTVQGMSANPSAVKAISDVQDIVKQYGADINPDSLRKLKQIFDDPVAARGGYAGADLATRYTLKAQKAAANSIRSIMEQANPDVAALNKEISFWLNVQRVTGQTALRRTGQEGFPSLTALALRAMRSPSARTAAGITMDRVANVLARGNVGEVSALLAKFGVATQEGQTSQPKRVPLGQPAGILGQR